MTDRSHPLLISERKENVVYLTLNRPAVLNALNKSLLLEIKKELEAIKNNPEIQAVVITGAGDKAFSAGADIEYLNQASPLQVRELAQLAVSVTHLIENLNKISIALINGFALGGGLELAESCMLRVAVTSAKFGHPEVRIGAVAGWGGTTRLPRLIGKSRAAEMLLTGKMVDANEALQMGLVNRVTEPENLRNEGEKLLLEILQNAPVAVNLTWDAVHRGLDLPIDESAKLGADYFGLVATTEDFREGTNAFLQKQKAKFHGR
ncbi:MAG: enoyl-CoA hydratase/isomerase family protein [Deltaproteobacteria bacterium]|nr:enoyl-CoA hydratase/isomerase family protein [Deltaproteobacteria bacterium]